VTKACQLTSSPNLLKMMCFNTGVWNNRKARPGQARAVQKTIWVTLSEVSWDTLLVFIKLIFCRKSGEPNFPLDKLRFVRLLSMIDPPKASVPDAVSKCRSAGIKVIMVTGDTPSQPRPLPRRWESSPPRMTSSSMTPILPSPTVIPGYVMMDLEESDLDKLIVSFTEIAFAMTSPQQKLFLVEGYQRAGNVVAVTGDGVNDSTALKKADNGVAMGIAVSEVSK
jgi:sodium/potassium-transporting ATPase subunit alpha